MKGKFYKEKSHTNNSMLPGDLQGSPDESINSNLNQTLVFIDDGFLSKLSKHLGRGKYLKFDKVKLIRNLLKKQYLFPKYIFYYTSPPFQSEPPTEEEEKRREGHDRFIRKLKKHKEIVIREGRVQRLKIDGKFLYKQKAVDSLAIIDLMKTPIKHPDIKKIVLIASDSD